TVGVDVAHQTGGNSRVIVEKLPETLGALELHAEEVGTHIDPRAVLLRPQLSQSVEMLESKAWRISATMAPGAARVFHVIEQPAADGAFGAVLNLGEIHVRR